MNRLTTSKVIACLAVIFVAGATAGSVVTWKKTRQQSTQPPTMEKVCTRLQDRLISKLGLSTAQVEKLQPIFDHTALELRAVHTRALCDTDQILRRAHEQMAQELSPEQKIRLQEFDRERREWMHHRLKGDSENRVAPSAKAPGASNAPPPQQVR